MLRALFRPPCSGAARHRVRLEMMLGFVPLGCALLAFVSVRAGDTPPRYQAVFFLHVILSTLLTCYGTWLWWQNCLPSFAHFLEDPRRSNDLLEYFFCWLPLLTLACPMLIWGSAQDIADTSIQVLGGFMYIPLLDEPFQLIMLWTCHSCLSAARIWHLLGPSRSLDVHLTPFLQRSFLMEFILFVTVQARLLRHSQNHTPLTPSSLAECDRVEEQRLDTSHRPRRRIVKMKVEHFVSDVRSCDGRRRAREVIARRQLRKEHLLGQFFWASHVYAQGQMDPLLLSYILSFLHDSELTSYLGLFRDDRQSQVSSGHTTKHTTSSPSSVSALRMRLLASPSALFERRLPAKQPAAAEPAQPPPWSLLNVFWALIGASCLPLASYCSLRSWLMDLLDSGMSCEDGPAGPCMVSYINQKDT